ncbi:hypothetical protein ACWPKO_22080 (plasmid) [Coraliomargarita sp. W4R53]
MLATILLFAASLALGSGVETANDCNPTLASAGLCSVITDGGSQLDISAGATLVGGGGGQNNNANPGNNGNGGNSNGESGNDSDAGPERSTIIPLEIVNDDRCTANVVPCRDDTTNEVVAQIEDITLQDLASFRPTTPTLTGEPLGFAVVGAPTNRVAVATTDQFAATILELDVTVRFIPDVFSFDNGDGTTITSAVGGATWEALTQAQFSPTATSHVYLEAGTYATNLTVQYAPFVALNPVSDWIRVPGHVTASAGTYAVQAVEARTALVDKTCIQDPNGPGC